jgi:hypothetical protein
MEFLIHLFHGRFLIVIIAIKRRQVIHIVISTGFIIIINGKTELDKTVDTGSKSSGFLQGETRSEQRGIVKEPDEILDSLVALVSFGLLAKSSDNRVGGVDFHGLLGTHVSRLGSITKCLGLHNTFHVGGPSVLASHETAWRVSKTVGNNDLFNLVVEDFLHELAQRFSLGLGKLKGGLLFLTLGNVKSFLGGREKLLSLVFLELLDGVLINGVGHEDDFVSLLLELLKERGGLDGALGFSSNVVDSGLGIVHAVDVVIETSHFLSGLGRAVTQELGNLGTVGRVLVDTELEVLGKGFVKLLVGILILGKFAEHFETLLDKILLDDTKNLVLLQGLTRNVEGKILRVDNTLDEGEPLGHDILAVIHDKDTSDVKLDHVVLLLGASLEHIKWSTLGGKETGLEFELTLHRKVLDGGMLFPVVGDGLVESNILVVGDIIRLAHPDGLGVVEMFPLMADLFDLLGLFLLFVLIIDLFNLGLVGITFFVVILVFIISDLLLSGLLGVKLDGESNEFRVLLDEILDTLLLQVFGHVLLHVENDSGTSGQSGIFSLVDGERTSSLGSPDVATVVVVLGHDFDLVGNEIRRVETDTELTNHTNIGTRIESLHERLGSRLGNGTKIVDEISLCHTDTGIFNDKRVVGFVSGELDLKLGFGVHDGAVGERLVSDLIEGITGIGDQLTEENFLVGVESVDNCGGK